MCFFVLECDKYKEESNINQLLGSIKPNRPEPSNFRLNETECSLSAQPLDLSAPVVQDEKTDHYLREYSPSIVNTTSNTTIENEKDDSAQFDSDKENQKSNVKLIEVTITRADGKENYQPCDLFLNDIARLVPKLIGKDCKEIDILDRTCDHYVDFQKHRLYYVISESTWQLFQSANDRVILTNDRSLGQPVQNQGKDERPTYLVFDQFSLAKCLADYCKEIGGCFEYTFVEESKQEIVEPSEISIQNHNFENRKPVEECKAKIKRDPDATSPENLSEVSESYQGKSETKQEREEDITISSDGNACGNLININATLKKRQIKESTASDIKSCVFEQREDMEKEQKNHLEELISESSNRSKLVSTDNLNAECDECIKETVLKEVRENRTVEGEGKSTESSQMAVDAIENLGKCKKGGQVTRTKKGEMTANSQIPLETKLRRSQRSESNTEKRIPKNITRKSVANNLKSEKSNKPSYMKTRSKSTSEIVLQNRMRREKFVTSQNSDKSKEGSRRGTKRKHSPSEDLKKTTSGEISVLQSQVRRTTRSDKENQIKSNSKRLVESGHKKGEKKVKNSETIKKNLSSGKSKSSKRLLQMQKTKSENNSAKKKAKNNKMKFWKENSKKNEISKSGTKQEIKKGKKVLHKGKKYN